ncbi:DUF2442 domain-containing protein [Rhizobium leguminosarum]|uniref:DUF2442 domain-containing protein n=1 Tax=Rhizobium leguminosarum TaxID=384 RepID=UPI003D04A628
MSHPPTSHVRYDRRSGAIVVEFHNGSAFVVPARSLEGLANASDAEIAKVELHDGSVLHWEKLDIRHEIGLLMEGVFETEASEVVQSPGARPGLVEKPPPAVWIGQVIEFLSSNLPGDREFGWQHDFVTAYQIACETLIVLGQAEETAHGAMPRNDPELPDTLPRWDDLATAVVYLAAQNGLITFLAPGEATQSELLGAGFGGSRQPGREMWAARASPEVTSVFRALGLLDGNGWTAESETILWRENPAEWRIDFKNDPRFIRALDDACEHMPESIRAEVDGIAQITDEAIAVHSDRGIDPSEEGSESVMRLPPKTTEQVKASIRRIRRHDLDELFYKFWRIDEGWLSPEEAKRALEIFNDPLAIAMRKAVAGRLYPHWPHFAE